MVLTVLSSQGSPSLFRTARTEVGGWGEKFVFNYLTGVGQTLLLGFFFFSSFLLSSFLSFFFFLNKEKKSWKRGAGLVLGAGDFPGHQLHC